MKKRQLHFYGRSVPYRLLRKFKNLYQRTRLLMAGNNPSEKEIQRLMTKLERVYHRIARMLQRTGVKLAGTTLALMLAATQVQAQTITFEKVGYLGGIEVGDNAAPAFADIDGDGDLDAFIGNKQGYIKYYENDGSGAFTEPAAEFNPFNGVNVGSYADPTFVDIDNDGDLDAFIGEEYGTIKYYRNDLNDPDLGVFSPQIGAYDSDTGEGNPLNGMSVGGDYGFASPAFADLDGDGDMDAFIGDYYGDITYFENTHINGNVVIGHPAFDENGIENPLAALGVGYNAAPAFADIDEDGDLDAFIGANSGTITYYKNTGTNMVPDFSNQDEVVNPFYGVDVGSNATPAFADIDGDGDLDAMIGDRHGTIKYYENDGNGVFSNANPFDGVDVGSNSAPAFADIGGDGVDAFIGSGSGKGFQGIKYYENTSTNINLVFEEMEGDANPFDGEDVGSNPTPAFADIDGDGDLDAFIGNKQGYIKYYENDGSGAFTEPAAELNPFDEVNVGDYSVLAFADIDGDSDLNAFIGNGDGTIKHYERDENGVFIELEPQLNPFDGVFVGYKAAPAFVDIDTDGDLDVFIGNQFGTIKYYENNGNGVFTEKTEELNPFDEVDVGYDANPAFADIDGDGDLDAFIGADDGTIKYYENTTLRPPVITSNDGGDTASIDANENQTTVTTVAATDPDGDAITYSITEGADQALFSIDAASGELTFIAAPDFELPADVGTDNTYEVEVTVTDDGTGNLADIQTITVNVQNVNDNPIITGEATAVIEADENQTAVTTVAATDADEDAIIYSLTGGADLDLFSIDAASGELIFQAAPDFEAPLDAGADNGYEVVVTATDDGVGALTDVQTITVSVQNLNDNLPVITGGATAAIEANENQTAVTTVVATDADEDAITYSLTGGADQALFSIDAASGELTFQAAPDFEAPADAGGDNGYEVEVTATDDGTGNLTDIQTITVNVQDVNEAVAQTITFNTIDDQFLEVGKLTLSAATTSGLDVVFELVSGSATIDGKVVSFTDLGTVTIRVTQAGNADFLAAEAVEQSFEVVTVTGLDDLTSLKEVKIYPNPVIDYLHIDYSGKEDMQVKVFSSNGIEVLRGNAVQNRIALSGLQKGVYFLLLATPNQSSVHKIIKN